MIRHDHEATQFIARASKKWSALSMICAPMPGAASRRPYLIQPGFSAGNGLLRKSCQSLLDRGAGWRFSPILPCEGPALAVSLREQSARRKLRSTKAPSCAKWGANAVIELVRAFPGPNRRTPAGAGRFRRRDHRLLLSSSCGRRTD